MRRQEQSGGDDSLNIQAGQDATVYVGVTASEVRNIALDVFRANFLELRGIAEEVARDRAERITREFIDTLQARNPAGLSSIQDPDMQLSIYNAQKGYACSGDEDLEAALIDLLVERAGQKSRDLKTLVLNQAIEYLPRLTTGQRKAIAVVFLVRYVRYAGPLSLPLFYGYLTTHLASFCDIAINKLADYRYLQSVGICGPLPSTSPKLEKIFWYNSCGLFTTGFTLGEIPEEARSFGDDRSVIVPCIRNSEKLQVNAVSHDDIKNLQTVKGVKFSATSAGSLDTAHLYGQMIDAEIRKDLITNVPVMGQLFDNWDNSALGSFDLTAVGTAIGHAYWRRVTGALTPLDPWL